MPGTITSDFTTVDAADASTVNWTTLGTWATGTPLANVDMLIQGANCVIGRVSATTGWAFAPATAGNDLTTSQRHVFIWLKNVTWPGTDTRANGGLRVCISSDAAPTLTGTTPSNGPTNSKNWYVGGKDVNSTEGWVCYVIDPNSTPDLTIGSIVLTSVKVYGGAFKITSTIGAGNFKPDNCMFDLVKFGSGLTINNGTSSAPVGLVDIFNSDSSNTNAYGVITRQNGVYYGGGKLTFGTTGQSAITYFQDTNQVLVFQPFQVANSFYEIITAGAASFNTTFQLGTFASSVASGGCTISGAFGTGIGAPTAPTGAAAAGAGLGIGNYLYKITFVTSVGETNGGTESATVTTTGGNQQVSLTSIPLGPGRTTARNVYRTKVGGASGSELFVTSIANNTATTLTDSTADSALGRAVPTVDSTVSSAWTLTANATNTVTNLYGCTFSQMRSGALNSSSAMQSCVVSGSGALTTNGATVNSCTFSNTQLQAPISGTWAMIINSTSEMAAVTNCKFVNCNKAIKITAAGTYTFSGITFSGNVFDIENSSSGAVIINATNGSNPGTFTNTGGGSTTINNAVTVTVTVQNPAGTAIQNARVAVYQASSIIAGTELVNALTNSSGIVSTSFNFTGNTNIVVRVRAETPFLSTPSISSLSTTSTGGSLAGNTTFYYRISALNDLGETLASTESSQLTATGTSTNTVTINWNTVTDAASYNVYGRTTGTEQKIANVVGSTSYTDTGTITPSGALPSSNTTGTIRYVPVSANGVITTSGYSGLFTLTADTIASSSAI